MNWKLEVRKKGRQARSPRKWPMARGGPAPKSARFQSQTVYAGALVFLAEWGLCLHMSERQAE